MGMTITRIHMPRFIVLMASAVLCLTAPIKAQENKTVEHHLIRIERMLEEILSRLDDIEHQEGHGKLQAQPEDIYAKLRVMSCDVTPADDMERNPAAAQGVVIDYVINTQGGRSFEEADPACKSGTLKVEIGDRVLFHGWVLCQGTPEKTYVPGGPCLYFYRHVYGNRGDGYVRIKGVPYEKIAEVPEWVKLFKEAPVRIQAGDVFILRAFKRDL